MAAELIKLYSNTKEYKIAAKKLMRREFATKEFRSTKHFESTKNVNLSRNNISGAISKD